MDSPCLQRKLSARTAGSKVAPVYSRSPWTPVWGGPVPAFTAKTWNPLATEYPIQKFWWKVPIRPLPFDELPALLRERFRLPESVFQPVLGTCHLLALVPVFFME